MNLDDDDTVDELPAPPRKDIPPADLELLEQAARALGATFEEVDGEGYGNLHFEDGSVVYGWNSLLFYGDTFELAVRLNMNIEITDGGWVYACGDYGNCSEPSGDNKASATARAVTRAAAEIGKQRSS